MFVRPAVEAQGLPGIVMSCIILVAEDDVVIRNTARRLLQAEGHEVLVATNGYEALELSRDYHGVIDILLTDLRMPRMGGVELITEIVKDRPGMKILVMAGRIGGGEIPNV